MCMRGQGRLFGEHLAPDWQERKARPSLWCGPPQNNETASPALQALLAPAVLADADRASRFLNKLLDNANWALTELTRAFKLVYEARPGSATSATAAVTLDSAVRRTMTMFEATHNIFEVRSAKTSAEEAPKKHRLGDPARVLQTTHQDPKKCRRSAGVGNPARSGLV